MSPLKFEVCVDSIAGIRAAREADAERVELCANLLEGGTTPSLGTILVARKVADIKLHVMIRPRGGDFLYDEDEIATMEADIASAKSAAEAKTAAEQAAAVRADLQSKQSRLQLQIAMVKGQYLALTPNQREALAAMPPPPIPMPIPNMFSASEDAAPR